MFLRNGTAVGWVRMLSTDVMFVLFHNTSLYDLEAAELRPPVLVLSFTKAQWLACPRLEWSVVRLYMCRSQCKRSPVCFCGLLTMTRGRIKSSHSCTTVQFLGHPVHKLQLNSDENHTLRSKPDVTIGSVKHIVMWLSHVRCKQIPWLADKVHVCFIYLMSVWCLPAWHPTGRCHCSFWWCWVSCLGFSPALLDTLKCAPSSSGMLACFSLVSILHKAVTLVVLFLCLCLSVPAVSRVFNTCGLQLAFVIRWHLKRLKM